MEMTTENFCLDGRNLILTSDQREYVKSVSETDWSNDRLVQLAKGLAPGSTYLDVGANIGATAIAVAASCPALKVFAFEPLPSNADLLRKNVRDNAIGNCSVVHAAVGNTTGSIKMLGTGPWAIVAESDSSCSVPIITLDEYCMDNLNGISIDLIKIDVEGYEPNVLSGARNIIDKWKPIIFLEFNSWTLLMQQFNPIFFAEALFKSFDIECRDGSRPISPNALVHDNIILHRCITDLVMRPRKIFTPIRLAEIKFGGAKDNQIVSANTAGFNEQEAPLEEFIQSTMALGDVFADADHTTIAARLNETLARYLARSHARVAVSFEFADLMADLRVDHGELCLVRIEGNRVRLFLHQDWRGVYSFGGMARRCAGVVFLLDHMLRRHPEIRGTFLCELGDRGNFPSVNFSNNTPGGCLIPDPEFFESRGYEATRQQFREDFIPWEQRLTQVFWRGSSTGHRLFDPPGEDAADDFAWLQRLALCARARSAARPDMFDVGLTRIVQIEEPHLIARIERAGFLRPHVPRVEFMRHKGVIVADGNCNAWDAAFCGLLTGSCVLLVGSPLRYRQWYYDALKPWEHYVPVAADLSDLEEAAAWVLGHDDRARAIGAAGRRFALAQSFDAAIEDAITRLAAWIPHNPFAGFAPRGEENSS